MITLLIGCGTFGLQKDALGDVAGLSVDAIEPAWGLPDEETTVTITGAGLAEANAVWFGNAQVDVTTIDDASIVVTAPAAGLEATVDVRVATADDSVTLDDAFAYRSEAPPDDTADDTDDDTDTDDTDDTDNDNTGMTGGLVQFSLLQIACPDCVGATSDLQVSAQAAFHGPTRGGWLDWLPNEGSCVTNPDLSGPTSAFLDAGEWIYLTSGSRSVGMRTASGVYGADGLDQADFVRNAAYDLSAPQGGDDLRSFDVLDALTTPQSLSTVTPEEMLLVSSRDAFSARVARSGASFTWSPSGGSGSFVVELGIYGGSDGRYLGTVLCRGPDNGRLQVPSGSLSAFPGGSLLTIGMNRYTIGSFERPDDGSTVDTVTSIGVLGTGVLQ